jgi:hypothetical protein
VADLAALRHTAPAMASTFNTIMPSLPAAASHPDRGRPSHPDCRATLGTAPPAPAGLVFGLVHAYTAELIASIIPVSSLATAIHPRLKRSNLAGRPAVRRHYRPWISRRQTRVNLIRIRFDIVVTIKINGTGHALDVSSAEQWLNVVLEAN